MASDRMNIPDGFDDYLAWRRPALEDAYNRTLSLLLGGAAVRDMAALMDALKAGKKIRGCLSCLVCESLGGAAESAIPRAVAVEMIQAATLIHDDFVDRDRVRGDRPAVWTIEGPRKAVLIGDVIFASAIKMMSDVSADDGRAAAHAIAHVSRGALHEPTDALALAAEIESDGSSGQLYDKIVRLKTGILFGAACMLGAIAAGGGEELTQTCYRYGLLIGEAYQIADDMKEVRHYLSCRSITPRRMVALAPALLRFVSEMRPVVADVLRGNRTNLNGPSTELLKRALRLMEDEIGRRLRAATSEIEGTFPTNSYRALAQKAPGDILHIFNESP